MCDVEAHECRLTVAPEVAVNLLGAGGSYPYYYSYTSDSAVSAGDFVSAAFGWVILFVMICLIIAGVVWYIVYRVMHRNDDDDDM